MSEIKFGPIGVIRSPFKTAKGTPIQSAAGRDVEATVEVFPEYAEGLQDLEGFSHLILLYHCHRARPYTLKVLPFMDSIPHGVFATRAPARPNAIGLSVVRLVSRKGSVLTIRDVDILDGTPLLDIKPYFEEADACRNTRKGWLQGRMKEIYRTRDDSRFVQEDMEVQEDE